MEDNCFFCDKKATEITELCLRNAGEKRNAKNELLPQFFKYLKRHLYSDNHGYSSKTEASVDFLNTFQKWNACKNCLKIVKSFCDFYHDLKSTELLLSSQLWTLTKIMKQSASKQKPNDLEQLRNKLIQKCSYKLISAYPHVSLKRLPEKVLREDKSDNLSMELIEGRLKSSKSKKSSQRNLISYKKRVRKSTRILRHRLQKKMAKVGPTHSTILNNLKLEPVQQMETDESTQSQDFENISQANVKDIKIDISETFLAKIEQNKEYFDSDDENTPPGSPEKLKNNSPESRFTRKLRTVHKCSPCNKTFSTLESLSTHQKKSECLDSRTSSGEENESGGSNVVEEAAEVDDDNYDANEASESDAESLHSSNEKEVILKEDVDSEGDLKDEESEEDQEMDNESSVDEANKKKYLIVKNKRGRWQCCFCKKSYPPAGKLRVHILSKHPSKWNLVQFQAKGRKPVISSCHKFKCPNCKNKVFEKAHLLLLHWKQAHETSNDKGKNSPLPVEIVSFTADPSTKIFQSLHKDLKKPKFFAKIEIPIPEQIFICDESKCERPFYSKEDLETHKKLHGTFSCMHCPETKTFLPELASHEMNCQRRNKLHINDQKCPRCDLKFTLKDFSIYLRHYCSTHFSLKFLEHSCPVCKSYLLKTEQNNGVGGLFKHLKRSHNLKNLKKSSEIFRCDEENCKAYFFKLYSLDFHKKVDHGLTQTQLEKARNARQNVCEVCGKGFKREDKFKLHLLVHSGPESWSFCCKVCLKKCISETKLKEHMRTHTNEKPFVCEVCGAKYAHRHNLRIHVNSKHGDVVQDIPKKYNTSNLSSKKGIKRKVCNESLEKTKKKRLPKKSKKERKALEDTDSEEDPQ